MRARRTGTVALAVALVVTAGCGGGGGKAATTTTRSADDSTTTSTEPASTTTTVDPALNDLLLVKADLPGFTEQAASSGGQDDDTPICDAVKAPAIDALDNVPTVDGDTFERGKEGAVEVSSSAASTTPQEAEAALTQFLDPAIRDCLEEYFRTILQKDLPAGVTATIKTTATKSTVPGADQTVLVASSASFKGPAGTLTVRADLVFLRKGGTVLFVSYIGLGTATSVAERQRIVAVAGRKLGGGSTSGSTTSTTGGGTSTSKQTGTTRRSGSTTSSTRSGSTTSTRI